MKSAFQQPVWIQHFTDKPTVGFGFCLAGQFEARPVCCRAPLAIKTGESGVFTSPQPVEIYEKVEGGPLRRVYLMLESEHLLKMAHGDERRSSLFFSEPGGP